MRNADCERLAAGEADLLRLKLSIDAKDAPVGLVLGTGWGDVLALEHESSVPFKELQGFNKLASLEGHRRLVSYGWLKGRTVLALRGRVHLNESHDPDHWRMVRLQVEMLLKLGVKTLILTCAAGSLLPGVLVGDIVLIDGFVTAFAPDMPGMGEEFGNPEDVIDQELLLRVLDTWTEGSLRIKSGGHAMLRGPFFEGRRYDKPLLRASGATVVGMSVLPEACIATLYPGVKVLPLAFVTNSATEEHSHEENLRRAKEAATSLGELLTHIVAQVPKP